MKKKLVSTKIFYRSKRPNFNTPYTWGEIKKILEEEKIELRDDDVLESGFDEGYDHGDSAKDACYYFSVVRTREETNAEFEQREAEWDEFKKRTKKERHQKYLELKKEFEHQ